MSHEFNDRNYYYPLTKVKTFHVQEVYACIGDGRSGKEE